MKKGFTLIDITVAVFLIGVIILMQSKSQNLMKTNIYSNRLDNQVLQLIQNTITEVNTTKDWKSLEDTTLKIQDNSVDIDYEYLGVTPYQTDKIQIKIIYDTTEKIINLERSVFYE